MISTLKDPKYNYLRHIWGLVLMVCSVFTLALSIQHAEAQKTGKNIVIKEKPVTAKADSSEEVKFKNMMITSRSHNEISITADTIFVDKKNK